MRVRALREGAAPEGSSTTTGIETPMNSSESAVDLFARGLIHDNRD